MAGSARVEQHHGHVDEVPWAGCPLIIAMAPSTMQRMTGPATAAPVPDRA